ncbi:MAG: hypothetical protein GWN32_05735, partial [Gemmatimonadetes bacterium]|nr:hypothetical protein [Pseudomonadales bacterium]NIW36034.1 hypothetical protein [Gemmatimonadota bacterium]NIX07339.1 hypothetical protein [Pseudomonadales bacterium]
PVAAEPEPEARPLLPPDVPQAFVRPRSDVDGERIRYVPAVLGMARMVYRDTRKGIDH